ncbi:MAG TPA: flippase [Sphingomicrobium sp.]|nr:flippase [Sphingomicrobium sp.]
MDGAARQKTHAEGAGRDTLYNLIAAVAPAFITLIVTPFYLRAIGPDRYGVLAICWTLVSAISFASLGMGPALTYRLALMEDSTPEARSRMVWSALLLSFAASVGGALIVFGTGELYFGHLFPATSALEFEISAALPLLSLMLPVGILAGVLNGALQGRGRFGTLSMITVGNFILTSLVPLAVAYRIGVDLKWLILATVSALAAALIVQLTICVSIIPLRGPEARLQDAKSLLSYGAWMSGTALVAPLVMMIDRFVVGALRGPTAVAAYVLPYSLVQRMVLIPASLSGAILPRFAPLSTQQDVQELQSRALSWLNGVLTPMAILAIALAAPFFHFWIGPALGSAASPVAAILLVGGWVHGIAHIPSTVVLGRSRPDLVTKLLIAYLVPYLVLLYVATAHFGIIGAATAWTIRAAFDPILFIYTQPRRSEMWAIARSAALVVFAMIAALVFPWTSFFYWAAMALLAGLACYDHREVLVASVSKARSFAFGGT